MIMVNIMRQMEEKNDVSSMEENNKRDKKVEFFPKGESIIKLMIPRVS